MVALFKRLVRRVRGRIELMRIRMDLRKMTGPEQVSRYLGLATLAFIVLFCAVRMSVYAQERVVDRVVKHHTKNQSRRLSVKEETPP